MIFKYCDSIITVGRLAVVNKSLWKYYIEHRDEFIKRYVTNPYLLCRFNFNTEMFKNFDFKDIDECLKIACSCGHIKIINFLITRGAKMVGNGYYAACENGHLEVLKLIPMTSEMAKKTSIDECLRLACQNGHEIVARYLFKYNIDKLGGIINYACRMGCLPLIKLSLELNTSNVIKNLNMGLIGAVQHGCVDNVKLLIERGATVTNSVLYEACYSGYLNVVDLLSKYGANDWNLGLKGGCQGNRPKVVENMIKRGGQLASPSVFNFICSRGYYDVVKILIEHQKFNITPGFEEACKYGYYDIVQLFASKGEFDWENRFYDACSYGHKNIAQFLIGKLNGDKNDILQKGLFKALDNYNRNIVNLFVEKKLCDLKPGIIHARKNGQFSYAELLFRAQPETLNTIESN